MTTRTIARRAGATLAAAALALTAACAGEAESTTTQASVVTITDPWVKAADADEMTAAFGMLRNASDEDVTVVSATADVTDVVELHEMAEDENGQMIMQRKEGGVAIAAGGTHELSPGGDHIMFLDLPEAIDPGQQVEVTLTFSDDSTMSFTAPARSFSGANEDYDPESGGGSMDMGDMDHGDMDHGDADHGDEGHDH